MSTHAPEKPQESSSAQLPFSLLLELTVHDPVTIDELTSCQEGELREQFALNALRIGVLSLRQARGQVDREALRHEGDRLLEMLQSRLSGHTKSVHERITTVLKDYFDPQSGQLQGRIDRLLKQDGELEDVLRRQIGGNDSELSKTLFSHFGHESPLMKLLHPDQSKGLLSSLRTTVDDQLRVQREHVLKEFSLDNKDGALARLIGELTTRQGELSDKLHRKIDEVVKEFSLDEETSALSRLVRNVDRAQRTITNEFSLDDDKSALARLKRELTSLIKQQYDSNQKFQEEVKSSLQTMAARREEAQKSTRHGLAFEDAVFQFMQHESQKCGDVATHTGNTTGHIKNCKVGDCTVQLGPESAAPGARIVIEAKEKQGYTLEEALTEIDRARHNRGAQIGIFIFSTKTAPPSLDPMARYGQDVVVVWDSDDAGSDLFSQVGLTLARALCVRNQNQREVESVDFSTMEQTILEIEKRASGLGDIGGWAETIQKRSDDILKRVRTSRKSLERQAEILRETMDDLKSALTHSDEAEP